MRAGLLQLTASDDPRQNLEVTEALLREAAAGGAELVLTPEVTNIISSSRAHQHEVLRREADDLTLARLRAVVAELGVWLLIGSLALKTGDDDGRFANRSFLIGPDGGIRARYDKIHMFDVTLTDGESYRESAGFRPGEALVCADTPWGPLGMTVCYDLRFPALYRALAQAGARLLTVPAAFTVPTGRAHWEVLLRARAIETGCFVLAPAQCGTHPGGGETPRRTWGHSLVVAPWGEVLADAGEAPGVTLVDLDLALVDSARRKVPSLQHDRPFSAAPGPA
ncbi:carbon-nitrogen hydrolase family protein [Paroceanicella profunda]|uniref:Carbon-nitrogen hydrolase family protein n=1 Tax=Paroceanicella profunda TaxID=2579971 RepID=A0A5B8G0V5_9RHOB|nr:carbon-nitrogen hydrolase family protein [Paroceanicella profunda]QDL92033.1 carbon-nitrogen hydrolase family protein [Paroceanicella profunda]